MKKNFLVTVSNDIENLYGIRFLCSFFDRLSEHRITLLHICRQDGGDMAGTLNQMWANPEGESDSQLTVGARRCLKRAGELLTESRMAVELLKTKVVAERYGKVQDILAEGRQGLYDAIILGRRASYALQWLVERPADEIARNMLRDHGCSSPLWVCPDPEPSRKNVLACVDGSEHSLRAVDHVGYILSRQIHHTITLFHVGGEAQAGEFFSEAEKILGEHGIAPERVSRKTGWGLTVAGAIIAAAEEGGYAAIAIGQQGTGHRDMPGGSLLGSTTEKLLGKLERAALWCCP